MKIPLKRNHLIAIIVSTSLAVLVLLLLCTPSYNALVLDTSKRWYHARPLLLVGDTMICLRQHETYPTRKKALKRVPDDMWPSVISILDVRLIEIFPVIEEEEDDDDLPIRHYGKFQINASGHIGYLYLSYKNGRPYGTIRFPNWSNGVYEKLKKVRVKERYVYFTRSVTTPAEMRRTGAPFYFTQNYEGKYLVGGKMIKGQYRTDKGKFLWEATRTK